MSRQVDDTVFKNTASWAIFGEEFWAGEECEENKCVIGGLHADIHVNVCKGEKDWVGDPIPSHNGNIGFIR